MNKCRRRIMEFVHILGACLSLSWRTSGFYTSMRFLVVLGTAGLPLLLTYLAKYVMNLLEGSLVTETPRELCVVLLVCISGLSAARATLSTLGQYLQKVHDDLLSARLTMLLMDNSLKVDLEAFDDANYYDKLQTAGRDVMVVSGILWNVLSFIGFGLSAAGAVLLLCRENVLFGLLILLAALPSAISSAKYTKALYIYSVEKMNTERQKGYYQGLSTNKLFAQDMRLYRIGNLIKQRYQRLFDQVFRAEKKISKRRSLYKILLDCLPELAFMGITIYIADQIFKQQATIGDYTLYTGLMAQLISASAIVVNAAMQIYDNRLRITNITSLEAFQAKIKDGDLVLSEVSSIEFSLVSFKYPGTDRLVLKDISFRMEGTQKVALVGINGSGKSTLIKLLLRLYEPTQGRILINGQDIKKYTLESLRSKFSVYFQEMSNYCTTLRENVAWGDVSRDGCDRDIEAALRSGCGDDILRKAQLGLDTQLMRILHEDGMELSGGQHQKVALARTFYRRHQVLVLDEPSSSLDPQAEHEIFKALELLTKDKLTLFTSHRLSNVYLADRIIVLENGQISEEGTQEELLANDKTYARLFRYQQEKFQVTWEASE